MRRFLILLFAACIALTGCSTGGRESAEKQYTATFLSLFDTVTYVVGRAGSEAEFTEKANYVRDELEQYHRLFDIYEEYDGIANLKTINANAGVAPVEVDRRIIDMLLDCRRYYDITGGRVNVAMGAVLLLWHEAREAGINDPAGAYLPDEAALREAAEHCDIDSIVIDEQAGTVYISDPLTRLDVGAVAKGWAAQRVAEDAPEGLLISIGGNVCATGPKDESGTPWVVGVRDPKGAADDYLHTLKITGGCVVTSGDYQRAYMVDGEMYHHIIDPATLYPAKGWSSVTIVCADSALADALSTALFAADMDSGLAMLEACGAQAMWVAQDGSRYYSPGFEELIRT